MLSNHESVKVFDEKVAELAPDLIMFAGIDDSATIILDRMLSQTLYQVDKVAIYKDSVFSKVEQELLSKSHYGGTVSASLHRSLLPLIVAINFKEGCTEDENTQTMKRLKSMAHSIGDFGYDSIQLTKGLAMLARNAYVTLIISSRGYSPDYMSFYTTNLSRYFDVNHLAPSGRLSLSVKGLNYAYTEPMDAFILDAREPLVHIRNF